MSRLNSGPMAFSGKVMKAVGVAGVDVSENGVSKRLQIVMTPENSPALFGLAGCGRFDWIWGKFLICIT